jgi:hypothetical protein
MLANLAAQLHGIMHQLQLQRCKGHQQYHSLDLAVNFSTRQPVHIFAPLPLVLGLERTSFDPT